MKKGGGREIKRRREKGGGRNGRKNRRAGEKDKRRLEDRGAKVAGGVKKRTPEDPASARTRSGRGRI